MITLLSKSCNPRALAKSDPLTTAFIAAGGDGTIRSIAEAVANTGRSFGVLPLGTLNHFARDLHLALELEAAVAAIVDGIRAGCTRPVDVAEVTCVGETHRPGQTHRNFVNNSSLGAYPAMVMDRERMKKAGQNKWSALVTATLRAFLRFRCLTVTYAVNGKTQSCTTPFLFVGNNEYCLSGSRLGEREHLDRGQLSLYLAPNATRLTMLRFLAAAAIGRLKELPEFHVHLIEEFTVAAPHRRRLRVSLDGEVRRLAGPLTYRILPAALHVLCPAEPVETRA